MKQLFMGALAALLIAGCGKKTEAPPLGSGMMLEHFDTSVRAPDDLFRHVNGTWLKNTETTPRYSCAPSSKRRRRPRPTSRAPTSRRSATTTPASWTRRAWKSSASSRSAPNWRA
jgi:hypothetical protein